MENAGVIRKDLTLQEPELGAYYDTLLGSGTDTSRLHSMMELASAGKKYARWRSEHRFMRQDFIVQGKPLKLDRLALLTTNVLHLAHFRCDVGVAFYMR